MYRLPGKRTNGERPNRSAVHVGLVTRDPTDAPEIAAGEDSVCHTPLRRRAQQSTAEETACMSGRVIGIALPSMLKGADKVVRLNGDLLNGDAFQQHG